MTIIMFKDQADQGTTLPFVLYFDVNSLLLERTVALRIY